MQFRNFGVSFAVQMNMAAGRKSRFTWSTRLRQQDFFTVMLKRGYSDKITYVVFRKSGNLNFQKVSRQKVFPTCTLFPGVRRKSLNLLSCDFSDRVRDYRTQDDSDKWNVFKRLMIGSAFDISKHECSNCFMIVWSSTKRSPRLGKGNNNTLSPLPQIPP